MRKRRLCTVCAAAMLLLTGCSRGKLYDEPEEFPELQTGTYVNPDDPEDSYVTVLYDGREYVLYGTQSKTIRDSMIAACVGYLDGDTNERVYTLTDTTDYIAEFYVNGIMEQVNFLRAADTIGKDADTPDYISSLDYDIWK